MVAKRPTHARPSATAQRRANRRGTPSSQRPAPSSRHVAPARRSAGRRESAPAPSLRGSAPSGVRIPKPNGGEILLTRRHFLYGAIGVGALAAVGGGAVAVTSAMKQDDSGELAVLKVPEDAVTPSDALTEVDASSALGLVSSFELPYGTLVWANDDNVAACLLPTEQSKPLTQVGLLFLGSGSHSVVVPQAVGQDEGFEIYDVRACSTGLVWTEADILDNVWRVYSASFDGETVGDPQLLDEGTSDWETPTIAATSGFAFWQVLPRADGPARAEASLFKRAAFGTNEASVVYESHGRMSTPPYALADSVVITPRTDTSSIHHQLTRIDARTGDVMDVLVLPTSMKPLEAGYGNTGFMFSFDAIYNYGDGIANLGTYTPTAAVRLCGRRRLGKPRLQRRLLVPPFAHAHRGPCLVRALPHGEVVHHRGHRPGGEHVLRAGNEKRQRGLLRIPGLHRHGIHRGHLLQHRLPAHRRRSPEVLPRPRLGAGLLAPVPQRRRKGARRPAIPSERCA